MTVDRRQCENNDSYCNNVTHLHLERHEHEGGKFSCEESIVSVRDVSFAYGTETVLEDISFCVPNKCLVGIIGPNGGGKTTLLKLILGLLEPRKGTVEVFGCPASRLNGLRTQIGYVPQRFDLDWRFPASVWDIVISGCFPQLSMFQAVSRERKQRARNLMELVGVDAFVDRPIGQLSGGQQQRAFIARALVADPKLLVVDEPINGVDTAGQIQFFELIQKLRAELKLTIMMVSHDIGQLLRYSDYLACLNKRLHWHQGGTRLDIKMIEEVYGCELRAYLQDVSSKENQDKK